MEEKNELNDIILNKGASSSSNKKIVLAVAALGVILIIVVMLMNSLTSSGTDNLPQAILPPEPQMQAQAQNEIEEEPLFEEVEVIDDASQNNADLDQIAQRLKQESQEDETVQTVTQVQQPEPVKEAKKPQVKEKKVEKRVEKKTTPKTTPKATQTSNPYYVQVGSFSRYEPNKQFLSSITNKGFEYKYHKVTSQSKSFTKVLIGPFYSEKKARDALRTIRSSIEAGAFLTKI